MGEQAGERASEPRTNTNHIQLLPGEQEQENCSWESNEDMLTIRICTFRRRPPHLPLDPSCM